MNAVREKMPELPAALRLRLQTDFGLSAYDADVIVNQGPEMATYFLTVATTSGDAKQTANWISQHVLRVMNSQQKTLETLGLPAEALAELIKKIAGGELPKSRSRDVFDLLVEEGLTIETAMSQLGIAAVDESELIAICKELLDANPKIVADVQGGKQQAVGSLIGQAKKKNPNADPGRVRAICLELIAKG